MNNLTPFNFDSHGAGATMSSREIAELTGKSHKHVLVDIRKMADSLGNDSAEFSAQYQDGSGRLLPCFNLPKRETFILMTGYSTPARAKVIDRWQELEAVVALPSQPPVVKNSAMQLVIAQAIELDRLEQEQQGLAARLHLVEAKQPQEQNYFTVVGYSRYAGEVVSNNMAIAISRRATKISRERGIPIGDTTDPRYGLVNTYQADVLADVFAEYFETA